MGARVVTRPLADSAAGDGAHAAARARLVDELRHNGIGEERVLRAVGRVPRHRFVDPAWRADAYKNQPLPIGHGQTISQPYVVALMTQLLIEGGASPRVLEVGSGSGYQTAVLAELLPAVFSIERIKALSVRARALVGALGYRNVHFGYSDGCAGWPAHSPYGGILVTAAAEEIPQALTAQLDRRGRMVIPIGSPGGTQKLMVIDRTAQGMRYREAGLVSFVPLLPGRG